MSGIPSRRTFQSTSDKILFDVLEYSHFFCEEDPELEIIPLSGIGSVSESKVLTSLQQVSTSSEEHVDFISLSILLPRMR